MNSSVEIINNEYDYSNIIPEISYVSYLIKYLDGLSKKLKELIKKDEEKNEKLKEEFKMYDYKTTYGRTLNISVRQKNYVNSIDCEDYETFESAVKNNSIKNLSSLIIELNLDYKQGGISNLETHENSFVITFKPYDITFIRKSNHNEEQMNEIEKSINDILKQFPVGNSIFYSK